MLNLPPTPAKRTNSITQRNSTIWQALAIFILLVVAGIILSSIAATLQPSRAATLPPYLRGKIIASGSIAPSASQQHANPHIVITDSIPMTLPESYLGVGSALAQARSGDPNMRLQNYWLSSHSPGSPKENGDPFNAKWDNSASCGGCWPIGGQFQPDYDTAGYDYALYMPDNTSGYLQIYDPGYQPKPGYTASNGQGVMNTHFDHNTPCGDPSIIYPTPCPAGQPDFNNPSTTWCANNTLDTGDNEIGYSQCDTQAMSATTVYTLYYPDSTPNYFGDDVPAATWVVPANHLPDSSHILGQIDSTHLYSMTWVNFNNVPNPGYQIAPLNGNHQWRLNVNVPLDTDHNVQGVGAQNNYAIRVKTTDSGVQAYSIRRMPALNQVNAGISDFYLTGIPAEDAGKTMVISLFDPGDAAGSNYLQLMSPPTASNPITHTVTFDYYVHDNHNPPGPDHVFLGVDTINTTRPTYDTNDKWIDVVYHIPPASEYLGGYWQLRYNYTQQTRDRTVWEVSVSDTPPATATTTPTASDTATPTSTATNTATPTPSDTPTNTPTATDTPVPTNTATSVPSNTPLPTSTPQNTATNTPVPTNTPTNTPIATDTSTSTPSIAPTDTPSPTPSCVALGSWGYVANYATEMREMTAATDGNNVYVVGGFNFDIPSNLFGAYNPVANTWVYSASLPTYNARAGSAYAPNTGKLYVFGGYDNDFNTTSTTYIYNFATNSWSTGAPMPAGRLYPDVAYAGGKIYVVGGVDRNVIEQAQTWEYDPVADTWDTSRAPAPQTHSGAGTVVVGQYLYLIGGFSQYSDRYDIVNNTWVSKAPVPVALHVPGAGVINGKIYIFGGSLQAGRATQVYDPATDSWSAAPALNTARQHTAGVAIGNRLVIVAGDDGSFIQGTSTVESATIGACGSPTPPVATPTTTATPMLNPTNTPIPATATPVASITPTDCPNPFVDITGNVFYNAIHYLACRHVVNGTDATHYSPAGTSTRGQFAKVVVLGFGLPLTTPASPSFSDVPTSYFAYAYIETGYANHILSGFDAQSCAVAHAIFPCYLPNQAITRGQLTKLVVNAAGYALYTPTGGQPTFSDVSPSNVFFASIETAAHKGVVNGYPDHTFRPNLSIRRDEMAQIVFKAVTTP